VVTLTSGLHLVSKLGVRVVGSTLHNPADALLSSIDPDVYNHYSASHPRALFLEEGLESEPFTNVVLYANSRITSNPSMWIGDNDHVSAQLLARALFGRLYVERTTAPPGTSSTPTAPTR
jgi:hypothetical protein